MSRRSPGPEWTVLQEPTPSSHDNSEDELEQDTQEDDISPSSLKRKGDNTFPVATSKRAKLQPQRDDRADEESKSTYGQWLKQKYFNSHNRRPSINHNAVAGPSKPPAAQATQPRGSAAFEAPDIGGVPAKISLPNLNVRTYSGSIPQSRAPFKSSKMRKYSTPGDDSASSPPASASPPPETPTLRVETLGKFKDKSRPSGLSNLTQDRASNPKSSPPTTQKSKHKTKPPASISTPNDVIEVADESDEPSFKPQPRRLPHKPTKSMSASIPASEVIEISDEEDSPTMRNRSKSKSKSKAPFVKLSRVNDGPLSTLRVHTGKSKSGNGDPSRVTHKARHSLSGRLEGKRPQKKDPEQDIIVIFDSDDEESKALPSASASDRASGDAKSSRSALPRVSPPTMNYGDEDQVVRDLFPDLDPVPPPRPRPRPQAGASTSSASISTSNHDTRSQAASPPDSALDTDKTVRHVTKSRNTHNQAISAGSTISVNRYDNTHAASVGQATSAKATPSILKDDVSSAKTTADLRSTASVVRDPAVDAQGLGQATSIKDISNVPGTKTKVGLAAVVSAAVTAQSPSLPGPSSQLAGLSKKDAILAVPASISRDKDGVSVPVQAKMAAPVKVAAKTATPTRSNDLMDVDHKVASTSKSISSSFTPGNATSAKTPPDAKVDVKSSVASNSRTVADTAVQIYSSVAPIPTATISHRSTPSSRPASGNSGQARNDEPTSSTPTVKQQASSSGPASTSESESKTYNSFWSSVTVKDTSSSRETVRNQSDKEKIPAIRTAGQSSGLDMRTLKEVLTKEVPLDSTDKVASSLGSALSSVSSSTPVKVAPTAPASTASATKVTVAPATSVLGIAPTAGPSSGATSIAAPREIPSALASQRPSTPAKATATAAPVPFPSKSTPAPIPLPRKDVTPASASIVSSLPGRSSRQPSASLSVSEVQSRVPSPVRPPSQLGSSSSLAKQRSSIASTLTSDPTTQRSVSLASSVSSNTRTISASSSQPRKTLADVITQASQSNMLSRKSNGLSTHDAIDLRRDNDNSDVEMASPTFLDRSTFEDAIASAAVLQDLIQSSMASGQTRYLPSVNSSSTPTSPLSESRSTRSIVNASPVPPLPRRSVASPKKSPYVNAGAPANDVQAQNGAHTLTSTSESAALAISSDQSSGLSTNRAQARPKEPISTSESVARAISLNQPFMVSSQLLDNVRASTDTQKTSAQDESLAHAISSSQSPALPPIPRRSQSQPDARTVVPSSTSENVALAISSNKSPVPAGQVRDRPSLAVAVPLTSARNQTDSSVASHLANPSKEVPPRRIDSKLPPSSSQIYSPTARQLPPAASPHQPCRNLEGSTPESSAPAQKKISLSSSPICQSALPFNSQTTAADQPLDESTSNPNVPPVRSFTSSTLILTPTYDVFTKPSSKLAPDTSGPPTPPASKDLLSVTTSSDLPVKFYSPPEEAPESSSTRNNSPASMSDAAEKSVMNVDKVTDVILSTTVPPEENEHSEVENLLMTSMSPSRSVTPPPEVSALPAPSSVPVTTTTVLAPAEEPSYAGGVDDILGGRRRSFRLSSRSSSNDPMDIIPDDDDVHTPAESLSPSHSPTPDDVSGPIPIRTYGGFPSLNWQTFRQDIKNFIPKCYYAKDLPHALQDNINRWEESTRLLPQMRHVLQSAILENTADDEPDAPPIEIINNVDYEPTPPWEFHYSNKMWHTDGVPPPDVTMLTSCGCIGKCDPKSKTCTCIKRQQQYASDVYPDFAYDKNRRLRLPGYPIFECNDLCRCDDECRNRVVQHGRTVAISMSKTRDKGWGVFAGPRRIPSGTFIGIYAGELLTDEVGEERGKKYNAFGRTYLFDLDFYYLRGGTDEKDWDVKYVVDAYHTGNFTRFLNHSCDPNCQLVPCYINESNIDKPLLTVFARRDIEAGEELCFSYHGDHDDDSDNEQNSSPPASAEPSKSDEVYARCRCGSSRCTGKIFA